MNEFVSKDGVNTDLVDYLLSKGYSVVKSGQGYKIKVQKAHSGDLSSLSIFPNRHYWKRWSDGTHGSDAIEFCRVVYGMSFQEAVKELGDGLEHIKDIPLEKKIEMADGLKLPERYQGKFSRLYAYLIQTRGLAPEIVNALVSDGSIYQDERNNVVFVGRDEFQKVRFACLHGTNTAVNFKKDCAGSNKQFSFSVSGVDKTSLYIFESPIDLLSAGTLANRITGNSKEWLKHSRLSLSGVSDVALSHYLVVHQEVTDLHFWLDNDSAGRSASLELCRQYAGNGFRVFNHCPKCKDMNENLKEWCLKGNL